MTKFVKKLVSLFGSFLGRIGTSLCGHTDHTANSRSLALKRLMDADVASCGPCPEPPQPPLAPRPIRTAPINEDAGYHYWSNGERVTCRPGIGDKCE